MSPVFTGATGVDASHSSFTDVAGNVYNDNRTINVEGGNVHISRRPLDDLAKHLNPVTVFENRKQLCTEGTRAGVLETIYAWADDREGPNILMLSGTPGAGKSTVAATAAARFIDTEQLGAAFWFKYASINDASRVWPTVAHSLARFDEKIADDILTRHVFRDDIGFDSPCWQFEQLIKKPLSKLYADTSNQNQAPVIIIDALDECAKTGEEYWDFYRTLMKWSDLPGRCKLMITGRPEVISPLVVPRNSSQPAKVLYIQLHTGNAATKDDHDDIHHYLSDKFAEYALLVGLEQEHWPEERDLAILVDQAAGLFILAATMARFITDRTVHKPKERLEMVISGQMKNGDIRDLYLRILEDAFPASDTTSGDIDVLKTVLGVIFIAQRPLKKMGLEQMLPGINKKAIFSVLQRLKSILLETDGYIHLCHLSLKELLTNETEAFGYYIDLGKSNKTVLESCFSIMNKELRFNICGIETSYLPNTEIKGITEKIEKSIPDHLVYACCFWGEHMKEIAYSNGSGTGDLVYNMKVFLCQKLLYWLEVLSLVPRQSLSKAWIALLYIKKWTSTSQSILHDISEDAIKFIQNFHQPISTSVPHIYLSALIWCPEKSWMQKLWAIYNNTDLKIVAGRDQEWQPLLQQFSGHSKEVNAVAYSPDGRRVVSGSWDKTVRIWDAETGKVVGKPLEDHTDKVTSVAFSPDGRKIVSGSWDKTVRVWDAETGKVIGRPLQGHTNCVTSVAFSLDGKRVVSGSHDETVRIWDVETGKAVGEALKGHTKYVTSVVFSPDNRSVVSGSEDKTVRIWDAKTGKPVGEPWEGHTHWATSMAFSPDGRRMVFGLRDNTVRIWDAETKEPMNKPLQGHIDKVTSVAFSSDGRRVVSASHDKTIRIWDVETGKHIGEPFQGHTDKVTSVAFSPDGRSVVSGSKDQTIRIWDAETRKPMGESWEGNIDKVRVATFSPDGRRVVSSFLNKAVRIWDVETGKAIGEPLQGHTNNVTSVAFSSDGKRVVSGSWDKTIRIWNAETRKAMCEPLQGHTDWVTSVAFSPDGRRVYSCSLDKTVRIWDAETGKLMGEPLQGHTEPVTSVAFSPDGRRVVSGSYDTRIRIWDVETGKAIGKALKGHTNYVKSVAYSPDGTRVLSGSDDKTMRIWDAETGKAVGKALRGHTRLLRLVAFSPDGKRVISSSLDKTVRIWDVETGKALGEHLKGYINCVKFVALSPDGTRVLSGSDDGTVRIWDIATVSIFKTNLHDDYIQETCFNTDSGWITSADGKLILWIPASHRSQLCGWGLVTVIGGLCTRINMSHFKCGPLWQSCKLQEPADLTLQDLEALDERIRVAHCGPAAGTAASSSEETRPLPLNILQSDTESLQPKTQSIYPKAANIQPETQFIQPETSISGENLMNVVEGSIHEHQRKKVCQPKKFIKKLVCVLKGCKD